MKNIVVVGSINMDLITQTDRLPKMGESVEGRSFGRAHGGKGGNQACAAARLGGRVTILGCVGDDMFGMDLIQGLEENGIDGHCIKVCENTESGTASIIIYRGDNSIIAIPGANAKVTKEYIMANQDIIKKADLLILQLEIPMETVEYLICYGAEEGIPVMLNAAPAARFSEELFEKLDYLIVNETECEFYTDIAVNDIEAAKTGLKKLKEKKVKNIIVTLGDKGSVYNMGGEIIYEPARKVKAVDSTAAGDTFIGAVAVALLEGRNIGEAVAFGTKASSIVVTRVGAQTSIPSRKEVEDN
ncbi:MAG: ribokinase [Clostridia bacterium]|nr:ribokinase [Lachnospiraceae bacterium]NCB99233.1 ribokinase [Clostridia bacterium]NCD01383.1 ribokinase [Clostridia bacterium]